MPFGAVQFLAAGLFQFSMVGNVLASMPGDQHWDKQFGPVGTSDQLLSTAVFQGKVYVGGIMTGAGNNRVSSIAGYDGTNWFPLNNGVTGGPSSTYTYTLASDSTNLYVGGWFTDADNTGAKYIARWDGTNWSPLPAGSPNSIVLTIKVSGTNYFAGGLFTTNGGVVVNGIGRWTGSGWQAFGLGIGGGSIPNVASIEYDGVNLYVGGQFSTAGGNTASNVAQWNGSAWLPMGNGLPGNGAAGTVSALLKFGGYVYAGGSFTNSGLGITNLAKWDGSTWSAVGLGANLPVRDFLSTGTNFYIGGDFTLLNGTAINRIARGDGTNWSPLGAGVQGFGAGASPGIYRMSTNASGRLYVAGNFNQVGGVGVSHTAGWDGTNWFALGATASKGMTHFLGQTVGLFHDGTNLYAGGVFTEAGATIVNGTAVWNGTNWSALGSVVNGQQPTTQSRTFARIGSSLYAAGSFTNIGGVAAGRIAQWDGSAWHDIGDADSTIRSLVYDGSLLWAGGSFTNIAGNSTPCLAAYFPGFGWVGVGPVAGGTPTVNAVASDGLNLYIGGNFTSVNGVATANVAEFTSSSQWVPLGTGVNNTVNAIVVTNGAVYAGGTFTTAGGSTANRIAKWNGTSWSTFGTGLTGSSASSTVNAIAVNGTNVYVAGTFTNASGLYVPGVAKWNGIAWSGLGSGLTNSVAPNTPGTGAALALTGNDLYVGGSFTSAGDKPSMFIGRWNEQSNFYPAPVPLLTRQHVLTNGQFQFRLTGTSGETYVLQGSTNLTNWTPLQTNTTPLYDYTDPNTNLHNRFYRAAVSQ